MKKGDKQRATALRLLGKSYGEIKKILNIASKGTLSYWFKDIKLPPSAKKRLQNNMLLARKRGLFQFNKKRTIAIQKENNAATRDGQKKIGSLSKRELLLVGAALYWGEGTKSEQKKRTSALLLANTDPALIGIFMRFVREILQVPEERIRAGIQVHYNVNIPQAKKYWAEVMKLPIERFFITQQVSRASQYKRPTHILPFGTVRIVIAKRQLFYKVKGYIRGLAAVSTSDRR